MKLKFLNICFTNIREEMGISLCYFRQEIVHNRYLKLTVTGTSICIRMVSVFAVTNKI